METPPFEDHNPVSNDFEDTAKIDLAPGENVVGEILEVNTGTSF